MASRGVRVDAVQGLLGVSASACVLAVFGSQALCCLNIALVLKVRMVLSCTFPW